MINEKRLLDTFLEYVQIDSETKNEKAMGERLVPVSYTHLINSYIMKAL